ncbi:MAG: penicillin-binding protein 2 [Candidatus Cloacimonadota bacterium]|nr:penicillin-binding protein 2 [Candidatus Cloacimonadota bacterium]
MYKRKQFSIFLKFALLGLYLLIIFTLYKIQILNGEKYAEIAQNNFVRLKKIKPVRGEIYDRNYEPIAVNKPSRNLYMTPGKIEDKKALINFLATNFPKTPEEIEQIIYQNRFRLYHDILLFQNIDYKTFVKISEKKNYYPSLFFRSEDIREYIYPNHFTGYVGKISESEYEKRKPEGYTINSMIGKTGLEKQYEKRLRGQEGYTILQVDAGGKNLDFLKHNLNKPATDGETLILTIDNRLQQYTDALLSEKGKGCIVVMDVQSGGILAYSSFPSYDPNIFVGGISNNEWQNILQDTDKPMLDRIIHGTYPPGSVFKPIPALFGLQNNLVERETKLTECTGGMQIGPRYYKCWYEEGHGKLNLTDAIKYSCDVYFYDLSLLIPFTEFHDFTKQNFLTVKAGIDLPMERAGFFPTRQWYSENYGKNISFTGLKVNLTIGQGELLVTPLQMCSFYNALANNGLWHTPHLFQKTIDTNPEQVQTKSLPVSPENIKIIQEALYEVVNGNYGTGTAASLPDIKVYGKTGSAENHMSDTTHAWFCGYAGWEEPEISFTVFLEAGGGGGSDAAPLAAQLVRFYGNLREK